LGGRSGPEATGSQARPRTVFPPDSPVSSLSIAARFERGELPADTDLELAVEAVTAAAVLRARSYRIAG
jgi:hypothetical protein